MKSHSLTIVLTVLSILSITVSGQTKGNASTEITRVTLYSMISYNHDSTRSMVDLDSGARGMTPGQSPTGFDLIYGTMISGQDADWLQVHDSRSVIIDLGPRDWPEMKETPSFPQQIEPRPVVPPLTFKSSLGKDPSLYKQFVRVVPGHMYLMKARKGSNRTFFLIRIDSLSTRDNCVLSWKHMPPPKDDDGN